MAVRTAFIGLGVMGYPMAGHLARAGNEVRVFNRTVETAKRWADEHGGAMADSPARAAEGAAFVFTCVGNDDDLRSVTLGPGGALEGMGEGAMLIDHTTASAAVAGELAEAARSKGVRFLDAPVSGGQSGAQAGQLSVMIGGSEEDCAAARPVVDAYARAQTRIGPVGSGQLAKMVNQIALAGLTQALAEALAFALKSGLDTAQLLKAIGSGAAQSWMMDHRAETMIEDRFDFGFAVDLLRKDLDIALAQARVNGASLPATALVDQLLARVQATGSGRLDITSLMRLLR
jgi:3-hydroxyisobutyrate dehydrogenase/2-hydroxy-3-oxopropionate reductase